MTKIDRNCLAKRIVTYYKSLKDNAKFLTYKHFAEEKVPKSTIYNIIRKYEQCKEHVDLPRSGRPPKVDKKKVKLLYKTFNNKCYMSQRKIALSFDVNQSTISRVLKQKTGVNYYKKEKRPKYENNQEERVIKCSRKLATKTFVEKDVILDDEKYFSLSNTRIPGNDGYYTDNKSQAPPDIKYKRIDTHEDKVLIWLAISSKGLSEPYIHQSKNAIASPIYIKECLNKRLLPFIREHHQDNNYVFWPDLASAHYAKISLEWLKSNSIEYVERVSNPPELPLARPIETFWANLSQKVYGGGWQAKTTKQLVRRIRSKIKEIKEKDENLVQNLMKDIRKNLRKVADKRIDI